jgi:hypothetical protein
MPTDLRDFFISNNEANELLEDYEGAGDYLRIVGSQAGVMSRRESSMSKRASTASAGGIHDKSRDFERMREIISDRGVRDSRNIVTRARGSSLLRQRNEIPVSVVEWISLYDGEGKLMKGRIELMNMIFTRSCENDIRPEIWKVACFY